MGLLTQCEIKYGVLKLKFVKKPIKLILPHHTFTFNLHDFDVPSRGSSLLSKC